MKKKEKVYNQISKDPDILKDDYREADSLNKKSPSVFNIQNLYDMTNIKNGQNINEVANLICRIKKIKIISDDTFINQCKDFSLHFNKFGVETFLHKFNDDFKLDDSSVALIVTEDINKYEKLLIDIPPNNLLNIVGILSEKNRLHTMKKGYTLYFLDNMTFDKKSCVNAILNCIGINILVCLGRI